MPFSNLQLNYCWQELEDIHDRIDPSQLQTYKSWQKAQKSLFSWSKRVIKMQSINQSNQQRSVLTKSLGSLSKHDVADANFLFVNGRCHFATLRNFLTCYGVFLTKRKKIDTWGQTRPWTLTVCTLIYLPYH